MEGDSVSKSMPDLIKTGESTTVEFKEKFDERCNEVNIRMQ
jgi:hypothetical protein